jgi:LuxR family transcriptional regulator, maltose regulon positive regulatory protein
VRFWAGFIEAIRVVTPGFGADAADLLAINGHMSADVIASIANDATKLPTGSVIIVDDFHAAETAVLRDMTELRDRDLYFSPAQSRDLLANFGVEVAAADLKLLHQRSEGWAAALQMAAQTRVRPSRPGGTRRRCCAASIQRVAGWAPGISTASAAKRS